MISRSARSWISCGFPDKIIALPDPPVIPFDLLEGQGAKIAAGRYEFGYWKAEMAEFPGQRADEGDITAGFG